MSTLRGEVAEVWLLGSRLNGRLGGASTLGVHGYNLLMHHYHKTYHNRFNSGPMGYLVFFSKVCWRLPTLALQSLL